jgi:hypothetical protein
MANQKLGTAMPSWAKPMTPTSAARLRLAAASTPSGMAIAVDRQMAISASGRLRPMRSRTSSQTGTP